MAMAAARKRPRSAAPSQTPNASSRRASTPRADSLAWAIASLTYDAEGHLTRAKSGKYFESWAYTPDGTYAYTNNFPDSWEDCEADLIQVKRDKRGLNTVEVYDGCQIAATPQRR